jgi:hypothetical protein
MKEEEEEEKKKKKQWSKYQTANFGKSWISFLIKTNAGIVPCLGSRPISRKSLLLPHLVSSATATVFLNSH